MKNGLKSWASRIYGGLTATFILSNTATAASVSDTELASQVRLAESMRAIALINVDTDQLRAITDINYTHIESNGRLRTREEFIEGLTNSDYRFKTFVIDKIQVRIEKNIAISTGDYHNDIITKSGLQPTKHARFTRVWKLKKNQWINISHQATEYKPM